jgi:hypothetical protein
VQQEQQQRSLPPPPPPPPAAPPAPLARPPGGAARARGASVLSGNLAHGGTLGHMLPRDAPHLLELCSCDKQYDDHAENGGDRRCREASAANLGSSAPGPQSLVCPSWSANHIAFMFVAASEKPGSGGDTPWTFKRSSVLEAVARGSSTGSGSVFVHFQVPGLHVGMRPEDRPDLQAYFLEPLWAALREAPGSGRRRAVCVGLPARQANGPGGKFVETQGNHIVRPHNAWLQQACAEGSAAALLGRGGGGAGGSSAAQQRPGLDAAYSGFWDPLPFTLNASSQDGAHYDSRVNVPLAQLLLNVLAAEMEG